MKDKIDNQITGILIGMAIFAILFSPISNVVIPAIIICGLAYGAFVNLMRYLNERNS